MSDETTPRQETGDTPSLPTHPGPARTSSSDSEASAITALVLALIPAVLTQVAAIVMSIIVLGENQRGRGKAIAALSISGVWVLVGATLLAASLSGGSATRDTSGSVTASDELGPGALRLGDCGDDISEGTSFTVTVIPCTEPHRSEVYSTFELTKTPTTPTQDEIDQRSVDRCLMKFETFIGTSYQDSSLEFYYFSTSPEFWEVDRRVICLAVTPQDRAGSLQDSGL